MIVAQHKYSPNVGWEEIKHAELDADKYQLVLAFGSTGLLGDPSVFNQLREMYPKADIVMGSTAGEIIDTQVNDETVSCTAIYFEKTKIKIAVTNIDGEKSSYKAGLRLAKDLDPQGLKSVLVISDGHVVNGSELVTGLQESLPQGTVLTGGLAGDGANFKRTIVGLNEQPTEGRIVAIGFYGDQFNVTYGSVGGWDTFGPKRLITRAEANVLYELDGKPALDIYKMYLGEYANELPGSALLFPLSIQTEENNYSVVRTILSVNEGEKSMTFAGNMPVGAYAQLMKANFDRLIEGASNAAQNSIENVKGKKPELAILISCVGRKLVLDQRIEEEIEVVRAIYGNDTAIAGFYSYGEISPAFNFMKCELHNQTMTITTMAED